MTYITINIAMTVVDGFLENARIPTVDVVYWTLAFEYCQVQDE